MVSPNLSGPAAKVGIDYDGFFKGIQRSPRPIFDLFRLKPTWQQDEALDFIEYEHHLPLRARKKRMAICSGQGTGKTTFMCATVGFWRPFRGVDGQSIITAPTGRQCRDVYLGEARRLLVRAPKWFQNMVEIRHDRMNFCGRKTWGTLTATSTSDRNMQGFHNDLLTFYLEECSGLSRELIEQAKGTLTNEDSYLFAAGNPNLRACEFYQMFFGAEAHQWQRFWWDGEQSPIADKANQLRIGLEYGFDSDVYRVRVRGLFPRGNPDSILDADKLALAMDEERVGALRLHKLEDAEHHFQIGVDLARFGGDESVIAIREGRALVYMESMMNWEPQDVLERAADLQEAMGYPTDRTMFVVDAGGLGQGAMKTIYDRGKKAFEFHNGSKKCPRDYENKITEGWFRLRKLVREETIAFPADRRLHDQLETRTYKLADAEGKVKVRSKEEHKTDGLESPDRAEAAVYAFYNRTISNARVRKGSAPRRSAKVTHRVGSSVMEQLSA